MPVNGGATAAEHTIEFGSVHWSLYLGGDIAGTETSGGISWSWIGANRMWCTLPKLEQRDYNLVLHAAPFAPFSGELRELVVAADDRISSRKVVAARQPHVQTVFETPADKAILHWRTLPLPALSLELNDDPLARFEYEQRPDIQLRGCILRHQLISADRNVLFFTPNFSLSPDNMGIPGDQRQLSFRLFRAVITPLL